MRLFILSSTFLFGIMQAGFAQPVTFGVTAGAPVSHFVVPAGGGSVSTNYPTLTVGPTVEFAPSEGLSIALDGLYQRISYYALRGSQGAFTSIHSTGSAWDFPLRLKYAIRQSYIHPFVAAGASARLLADLNQTQGFQSFRGASIGGTSRPVELQNRFAIGFVVGGGVEVGIRHLHVAPEFRYTRWAWETTVNPTSNLNEAALLVSFRF